MTLTFIGGRGIMMDYSCAKFGDCTFSRFGFIIYLKYVFAFLIL